MASGFLTTCSHGGASEATTGIEVELDFSTVTTGKGIQVDLDALTSGTGFEFRVDSDIHTGKVIDIKSGSTIAAATSKFYVKADGTIGIGGTDLDATAAELTRLADKSASVVNCATATLAVTEALHGDRIITLNRAAGVTATLPAATGTGNRYTFIIGTAATSNANIVKAANATDVMDGSLNIQQDDDVDGNLKCWMAEVGDDTITLAGAATTGGIVGNRIECIDYAAGFWTCTVWTISSGGSEATPFSATVA